MARRIRTLLLIAGAFVVMTASACPPELCELFPEVCGGGLPSGQADSGREADPTPEPEVEAEPDLAEVGPEQGRT
jgi:hypothetical protein